MENLWIFGWERNIIFLLQWVAMLSSYIETYNL